MENISNWTGCIACAESTVSWKSLLSGKTSFSRQSSSVWWMKRLVFTAVVQRGWVKIQTVSLLSQIPVLPSPSLCMLVWPCVFIKNLNLDDPEWHETEGGGAREHLLTSDRLLVVVHLISVTSHYSVLSVTLSRHRPCLCISSSEISIILTWLLLQTTPAVFRHKQNFLFVFRNSGNVEKITRRQ